MSLNKICLNCGNSTFVSDRSLGGKIVCSKCGSSYFRNSSRVQYFSFFNGKNLIFLTIGIAILIIII